MNRSSHRRRWHPLLTVIILLVLSLTAWAVEQARQKVSPVSDKDYYRHGLAYNDGTDGQTNQPGRWSVAAHLDGPLLTVRLADQDGSPITGAKGEVVLLGSHPGAMQRFDFIVTETDSGQYQARLPRELQGQIMAQLTLAKGDASLHRSLMLNF